MVNPSWTDYVGAVAGVVGMLTGIFGAIMGYIGYRRSNQIKALDSSTHTGSEAARLGRAGCVARRTRSARRPTARAVRAL